MEQTYLIMSSQLYRKKSRIPVKLGAFEMVVVGKSTALTCIWVVGNSPSLASKQGFSTAPFL